MTISTVLAWIGYFFLFIGVPGGAIKALADPAQRARGQRLAARSLLAFIALLVASFIAASQGI